MLSQHARKNYGRGSPCLESFEFRTLPAAAPASNRRSAFPLHRCGRSEARHALHRSSRRLCAASLRRKPRQPIVMRTALRLIALLLLVTPAAQSAEPVAKQFLRYVYGADGIALTNICHSSDDLWMLRGARNTNALAALNTLQFDAKGTGVVSGIVGTDIYFVELRDGRVDPAFNLDGIYMMHRKLVLMFLYASLSGDQTTLRRLSTDASKVQIVGPKAAPGDMDQYGSIIEMMPVVRASKPVEDAKSRTVTYRVPLGDAALSLTLVKDGNTWKVDTSKTIRVPLEFFFR